MINKIKLRYFDNYNAQLKSTNFKEELIENGGYLFRHELNLRTELQVNNFFEFVIDGKMLSEIYCGKDKYLGFLSFNTGFLGSLDFFDSPIDSFLFDEFFIRSLLQKSVTEKQVNEIFSRYSNEELTEFGLENYLNLTNTSKPQIYGCRSCGECTKFFVEIKKDSNFYYWKITDDLKFKFEKNQYDNTFYSYLINRSKKMYSNNLYFYNSHKNDWEYGKSFGIIMR